MVFRDTFRIAIFQLLLVILVFFLLKVVTRDWYRAGLITSLFVLLFCSFGHISRLLSGWQLFGLKNWIPTILAACWAAIFIFVTWRIVRVLRNPIPINQFFNRLSIILFLLPIFQIGVYSFRSIGGDSAVPKTPALPARQQSSTRPPDIYYIILDEYGRSDVLKEVMSFDNSEFIRGLREKGFFVADDSHANYAITHFSLASSLNFTYLDDTSLQTVLDDSNGLAYISEMIQYSRARSFLTDSGYKFISIASGYSLTDFDDADVFIKPKNFINSFEFEYIGTTIFSLNMDAFISLRSRALIENAFNSLSTLPLDEPETPKFIFAHIMAAHVPFVYGPNGEKVDPWAFPDSSQKIDQSKGYKEAYIDQVTYMNKRLLKVIDAIFQNSTTKPIIIFQGDHGSESKLDWQSVEKTCLKERMSILNAYYLPDADFQKFYPSITPVNTFRLIFDTYYGTHYSMLEDRSYFSLWDQSYDFIDVSEKLDTCR